MPKVSAVMRKGKTDRRADGSFPIYARISATTTTFKSLRISVLPEHWIESQGIISKSHPRHRELNAIITERLQELEDASLKLEKMGSDFRAGDIKAKVERSAYQDFISFAQAHNARYARYYTKKGKDSVLSMLTDFCPNITWQHFSPVFVREWISHLRKKGLKEITIASKVKYIKQLVREAQGEGIMHWGENPFRGIKVSRKSTPKEGLTKEELQAFRNVITGGWMKKAQQIFLLQVNFRGMRIGDILTLKHEQIRDGRLHYTMSKSADHFVLEITPEAQRILSEISDPESHYLLPLVTEKKDPLKIGKQVANFTTMVNEHLKLVAFRAGIEKNISTHMARRTWSQIALKASNGNIRLIQLSLGHSNVAITEAYLEDNYQEELNALNRKIMG